MTNIYNAVLSALLLLLPLVTQAQVLEDSHLHGLSQRKTTRTITQPSGEQVVLRCVGDEHRVFWLTVDGAPTWYDEATQTLRYAYLQPDLTLLKSNRAVTAIDTAVAHQAAVTMRYWTQPAETRVAATQERAVLRAIGSPRIPVLLVEFADTVYQPFNTREAMDSMLNANDYNYRNSNGSVRKYFEVQSEGKFIPQFDVFGPYRLSQPMGYYGEDEGTVLDVRMSEMFAQAIDSAIASGVDFSVYKDGSGTIPNVSIIFAGTGQHLWLELTHRLYPKVERTSFTAKGYTFRSKLIADESIRWDNGTTTRAGAGTFIHEFGHVLGLPDFYDTGGNGGYGMDIWSVMDLGMHYNSRYHPTGYTAYEREYMGWLTIPTIEAAETITLRPLHEEGAELRAVKIVNPHDANEYFILENRQPSRYYPSVLGHGLMVTHVAYNASAWSSNKVNSKANMQRMHILPADGEQISYVTALQLFYNQKLDRDTAFKSLRNDFFPGTDNAFTSLTATSPRPLYVYNSDGKGTPGVLDRPIYNIRINPDRSVSFDYIDSTRTTIRSAVGQSYSTEVRYYTLSGLAVATLSADTSNALPALPKGIYIRVAGTQRDKIIIE